MRIREILPYQKYKKMVDLPNRKVMPHDESQLANKKARSQSNQAFLISLVFTNSSVI